MRFAFHEFFTLRHRFIGIFFFRKFVWHAIQREPTLNVRLFHFNIVRMNFIFKIKLNCPYCSVDFIPDRYLKIISYTKQLKMKLNSNVFCIEGGGWVHMSTGYNSMALRKTFRHQNISFVKHFLEVRQKNSTLCKLSILDELSSNFLLLFVFISCYFIVYHHFLIKQIECNVAQRDATHE